MEHIKNKTLIITGASQGIGEATARLFAKLGANVALIARSKEKIEKISTDINSNGGKSIAINCDVSKPDEVENAIKIFEKMYELEPIVASDTNSDRPLQAIFFAYYLNNDFDKCLEIPPEFESIYVIFIAALTAFERVCFVDPIKKTRFLLVTPKL